MRAVPKANEIGWEGNSQRNFEPHITATERAMKRPSGEFRDEKKSPNKHQNRANAMEKKGTTIMEADGDNVLPGQCRDLQNPSSQLQCDPEQ